MSWLWAWQLSFLPSSRMMLNRDQKHLASSLPFSQHHSPPGQVNPALILSTCVSFLSPLVSHPRVVKSVSASFWLQEAVSKRCEQRRILKKSCHCQTKLSGSPLGEELQQSSLIHTWFYHILQISGFGFWLILCVCVCCLFGFFFRLFACLF